jgi:hypothetical protein
MEMGMARPDHRKCRLLAETLAADAVDPVAEAAQIVARNGFDLEILLAGAADEGMEPLLPATWVSIASAPSDAMTNILASSILTRSDDFT